MINKRKINNFLILVLITICVCILLSLDLSFKNVVYRVVYNNNFSFAQINNWYQEKFGSPLPFNKYFESTLPVFDEKLKYSGYNKYKDGVSLNVGVDYLIPALDDGIVIFVGEKEGYGKTVIVQQESGIDVWYSNIKEINVKVYDYIKKGELIGSVDNNLYLVFIKNGEVIDYKKYI